MGKQLVNDKLPQPPASSGNHDFFHSDLFYPNLFRETLHMTAIPLLDPPPRAREERGGGKNCQRLIQFRQYYFFGIKISFNFAISDGLSSYRPAKVFAVVGPSIGSTSKSAFLASATNSGSRNVLMNPCWRTCRRSGGVPGATE